MTRFFTDEQIANWHRDGYLVLSQENGNCYFNEEQIKHLLEWTKEIEEWPETPGKWMKYYETSKKDGSRILQRIEDFFEYHEHFNQTFNGPKFMGLVSELFGEKGILFKEKVNMKLPGGDGFLPHQDVQAGWDMYGHSCHISMLVGLDFATEENGCLEIVAGQHKKGLLGPMGSAIPNDVVDTLVWEPLKTKPGDLVFFDSFVPHRSGPNNSDKPRRVLYVTYNKVSEGDFRRQYWNDKRRNYPPDCEREPGKEYKYKI